MKKPTIDKSNKIADFIHEHRHTPIDTPQNTVGELKQIKRQLDGLSRKLDKLIRNI